MTKTRCDWCVNPNRAIGTFTNRPGTIRADLCRDCAAIAKGEGWRQ